MKLVQDTFSTVDTIKIPDATRTPGTYKDVAGASAGSGTGQRFNITIDGTGAATVSVVKGGEGHAENDVITAPDIGSTGAQLTFEVDATVNVTKWQQFLPD